MVKWWFVGEKWSNSEISKNQYHFFSRKSLDMNSSWAEYEAALRETKVQLPPPPLPSSCFFYLKEGESKFLRNFDDFLAERTASRAADGKLCIHHSSTFELSLSSWGSVFMTKTVLGAFAKLQKPTTSFVMYFCRSVRMEQLDSYWKNFHKSPYLSVFRRR
jgi:hypothetical protein